MGFPDDYYALSRNLDLGGYAVKNSLYLEIDETTTPDAVADRGKLYTKSDHTLYYQDGAGAEHALGYADGSNTDHGGLLGLGDDDHTQYVLCAGTRGLSGDWDVGSYSITADGFKFSGTEVLTSGGAGYSDYYAATQHRFMTGSARFYGNIGIGVSPSYPLQMRVDKTDAGTFAFYQDFNVTLTTSGTHYNIIHYVAAHNVVIPAGETESGYLVGYATQMHINDSGFEGTLADQRAIWARTGIYSAGASGERTITNAYGVYIEGLSSAGTITNHWGVYQTGTGTKNYFAGDVGIGTSALDVYGSHTLTIAGSSPTFCIVDNSIQAFVTISQESNAACIARDGGDSLIVGYRDDSTAAFVEQWRTNSAGHIVMSNARRTYYVASGTTAGTEYVYAGGIGYVDIAYATAARFNSNVMVVGASGVGIGMTPTYTLDVSGNARILNSSYGFIIGKYSGQNRNWIAGQGTNTTLITSKASTYFLYDTDDGGSNDGFFVGRDGALDSTATIELSVTEGHVGINTNSPSDYADLTLKGGVLCLKETTTPTDDAGYGKLYTKSDNKLYFQDGAGSEHELATNTNAMPRCHIAGLILSYNATDPDADVDISVGECKDAAGSQDMSLGTALTKQLDASWSEGTNAGGLDTGSIAASTLYAVWLIKDSSSGTVDALFSTSFSAPTMPGSYDYKRLIGAVKTDSSSDIIRFLQIDDVFVYLGDASTNPPVDITDVSLAHQVWETGTLSSVPPKCQADCFFKLSNTSSSSTDDGSIWWRTTPPSSWTNTAQGMRVQTAGNFDELGGRAQVVVDASQQIDYAVEENSGAAQLTVQVFGFRMMTRREP